MSTIRDLANAIGSAARASKYRVTFAFPSGVAGVTNLDEVDVLAKTATAPGKEIGQIELWNQGRKLIIPGDTAFDGAWPVDFYLTENHSIRYDMLRWMDACDSYQRNRHTGNPTSIFADLKVEQLDSAGNVSAQYTLHNCFPSNVAEVSYGDDSADTVAEFNCVFSYSDWVTGSGEASNFTPMKATKNEIA